MEFIEYTEKKNALPAYPTVMKVESFITAGLVDYSDSNDGRYLLKKDAIDKMINTLQGRPVIIGHTHVTEENMNELAVGYVIDGEFNPNTGGFDCNIIIKDNDIVDSIKSGNNKVSCAYEPTEFGEGGMYSGLRYDAEIKNGVFTHLAIVKTPRYNDAKILINNFDGDKMFKKLFTANSQEEATQEEMVEIEGAQVPLSKLVEVYQEKVNSAKEEQETEESKKDEEEKTNEDKPEEKEEEKPEDKEEEGKEEEDKKEEPKENDIKEVVMTLINEYFENKKQEENIQVSANLEKSNALKAVALGRNDDLKKEYTTRAERILASNEKYRL